jgi:pimeloyl-ACP methyl ester carboxylesterase
MPELDINGTRLHYQRLGTPAPGAEPAIMIHGLLVGNLASWYFGAASTLAKNREVILYDLRGHGLSGKPPSGYDLQTMVGDLEGLVASLRLETVSLVGHSYGALVALHFALRNPGRVARLVVVEGPLPPSKAAQMDAVLESSPEQVLEALPEHLKAVLALKTRQGLRFVDRLKFLLCETDLVTQLRLERDVPDDVLETLEVPTLLIYGRQAQLTEVARRLERVLPAARLQQLDGGHYLPSEKPAELSEMIGSFFQ